jgi:gluconate 2-dehydrogenase gamma chain
MDDPYAVDRRGFLKTGAAAAAATAVACGPGGPWRALRTDEARTLAAACDRIIPKDDVAGAVEAGAVVFIDRQLATREKDQAEFWRRGLDGLDATARRRHQSRFADLDAATRDALLEDVEAGRVEAADWVGVDAASFFDRLVSYTMMGFYGDPRHGGNKDRVAWRMLGVPDPPVRGRLHETPPPPALAPRAAAAPRKV